MTNEEVRSLEPKALWNHFADLNAVPRPSKKEERVRQFMVDFGNSLGLPTRVDAIGNVIISKPATAGYENAPGVILQSHIDMVHQKNNDTIFDFDTQGIEMYVDGDWVRAKGTTLGADNGLGVAAIMAVFSSTTVQHPALEALFTIDEETGMTGAFHLEPNTLKGTRLLNLDSEDEGELYIGCAGGVDSTAIYDYTSTAPHAASKAYHIAVKGLLGGHSGIDIHSGRGNANKFLARMIYAVAKQDATAALADFEGGNLRNAIPREGHAVLVAAGAKTLEILEKEAAAIRAEYATLETKLSITFEGVAVAAEVATPQNTLAFVSALLAAPNGALRMSDQVPGLTETSSNLAAVVLRNGEISVKSLHRSSLDATRTYICNCFEAAFAGTPATIEHRGDYPGWAPNASSPLLATGKDVYNQLYGKIPDVKAIHAGLECGIFLKSHPHLDMLSFGPTIKGAHSPDERADIPTTQRFWDYLVAMLAALKS